MFVIFTKKTYFCKLSVVVLIGCYYADYELLNREWFVPDSGEAV